MSLTEKSYTKLAMYCYNMEKINYKSTFFIDTDGENHFKYFFITLVYAYANFEI